LKYEPSLFVEPLGYQPLEFLDIEPMHERLEADLLYEQLRLMERAARRPCGARVGL
jgi:hypothetical protein